MTDPSRHPRADGDRASSLRRWVTVVGIVIAIAVLLAVVMMLAGGGGGHGPGRHKQTIDTGAIDHTPPAAMLATPGGHR